MSRFPTNLCTHVGCIGIVAIIFLTPGHVRAAESALFSQAWMLCEQNDGRPDGVLTAADSAGWKKLPTVSGFDMQPSPFYRTKEYDGEHLILHVGQKIKDSKIGPLEDFICSVSSDRENEKSVYDAMRENFRVPEVDDGAAGKRWIFSAGVGSRSFLKSEPSQEYTNALKGEGVVALSVKGDGTTTVVVYEKSKLKR